MLLCTSGVAQRIQSIKPQHPVICYHSFENRPDHISVSEKFRPLREANAGRTNTATIEVEYINFPADGAAKAAFEYAVAIWESELTSSVPIRIQADWRPLASGVLGQAIWGTAHANFGGEQHMNVFYPVALAEKISGKELNSSTEPDIVASFNSNTSWYFGTDGKTPTGKMDMVTIVLHEIAHGLGFTDTYDVSANQGTVGMSSGGKAVPFIFDVFVENDLNQELLYNFQSPSTALATQLQSNKLFFNGLAATKVLTGISPKLYAPASFDNGSSISHLDETTFNAQQDANRLMTPQIAFAESIHDPGSVLLATLADMGWVYTNIDHTALKDTERKNGQPYTVTTKIRSDNGYDPASVKLHYTSDGATFTTIAMTATGTADQFTATLPGRTTDWTYAYYISVEDVTDRIFTSPGKVEESGKEPEQGTHFFRIGPDVSAPVILHEPVQFIPEQTSQLELTAEATDNAGIKEVIVEYAINDQAMQTGIMQRAGNTDVFQITVALPALDFEDVITYRITARDVAGIENITTLPAQDFFMIDMTGTMPVQDHYINNFNEPSADFFGTNFKIATPDGFNDATIHSDHPYKNGSGPNNESSYTYQLQIPIRIGDTNPVISFDEIVLVEPGDDGSIFGDLDFFDYVIVEGSVDGGLSWEPFGPGYDSRAADAWRTRYISRMSGDDSEATGEAQLFRRRDINMVENGNFFEGDEVLIRFRLFADELAHGWGWAIDNLAIQKDAVTGVNKPEERLFELFPVPASADITLSYDPQGDITPLLISITDAVGRQVYSEVIAAQGKLTRRTINVAQLTDGFYILQVRAGRQAVTRKFIKKRE
jgi:hypothetical protein